MTDQLSASQNHHADGVALGCEPRADSPDEDLVDTQDRGPAFWFESIGEPRPRRG